jgi:hypothetical protein
MIDSGHAGLEAETSRRAAHCRPRQQVLSPPAADAADLVPLPVTSESLNELTIQTADTEPDLRDQPGCLG